jgi:hypothetical protein
MTTEVHHFSNDDKTGPGKMTTAVHHFLNEDETNCGTG